MNAEILADCLENPSRLYQINFQELKSLVLQYPFAHNLRYLLVLKAKQSGKKDIAHLLADAALFSGDRPYLQTLMEGQKKVEKLNLSAGSDEEYLALPSLGGEEQKSPVEGEDIIQEEGAAGDEVGKTETVEEAKNEDNLIDFFPDEGEESQDKGEDRESTLWGELNEIYPGGELLYEGEGRRAGCLAGVMIKSARLVRSKLMEKNRIAEPTKDDGIALTTPAMRLKPQRKEEFKSWKMQMQIPHIQVGTGVFFKSKKDDEQEEAITSKTRIAKAMAIQSVTDREDVASETLAELLVRQGNKNKAIEMYQRLSLLFPNKSSYFANRIEQLKK